MTKCKKKNCSNQVEEGNKYCKFHQSKREENAKILVGLGTAVMGGIGFIKKFKK